jgi:hypothetical protein
MSKNQNNKNYQKIYLNSKLTLKKLKKKKSSSNISYEQTPKNDIILLDSKDDIVLLEDKNSIYKNDAKIDYSEYDAKIKIYPSILYKKESYINYPFYKHKE